MFTLNEYTHVDDHNGVIGIEVKYTEHEYKLIAGSKQESDIKNINSKYYIISEKCNLYNPDAIKSLPTDKYRQVWRNQLLGESIIIEDNSKFKHFNSLTIFPEGNEHFIETSAEYMDMLENNNDRFIPVTYEDFIISCKKHIPNDEFKKWVVYLSNRYIIK